MSSDAAFSGDPADAVIHFAGLKAVGESVQKPLDYYQNNLDATMALCRVMPRFGCSGQPLLGLRSQCEGIKPLGVAVNDVPQGGQ